MIRHITDLIRNALGIPVDQSKYWEKRADLHYYEIVIEWINEQGGDWILDVGAKSTPIVLEGIFERRTALDINSFTTELPGVEHIVADWIDFPIEEQADLVMCLQVLEHLDDDTVVPFARKVLSAGKRAIISVPYEWSKKACKQHLQDPVDLEKLAKWTGREPTKHHIERRDRMERLIALYDSTGE